MPVRLALGYTSGSTKSVLMFLYSTTGATFDVLSPAESAVSLTLEVLLDPYRAARLVEQSAADCGLPGFTDLCASLMDATWYSARSTGMPGLIQRRTSNLTLLALLRLGLNPDASPETRSIASDSVNALEKLLSNRVATEEDPSWRALMVDSLLLIDRVRDNPEVLAQLPPTPVPPGSPIGAGDMH